MELVRGIGWNVDGVSGPYYRCLPSKRPAAKLAKGDPSLLKISGAVCFSVRYKHRFTVSAFRHEGIEFVRISEYSPFRDPRRPEAPGLEQG